MFRTDGGFDPQKKMEVQQTAEGTPKYVPETVMGMPVYTEDKKMVMRPAMKIPPNVMIEWLKTEYPNSSVEFVRHTGNPLIVDGRVIYPPEVFECRIWLNGRRGDEPFDGNGFARRLDDDYSEFDPMGSARTGSFVSAMRFLGFGCDLKYEEMTFSYKGIEPVKEADVKDKSFTIESIGDGKYIESGRNSETLSRDTVAEMVSEIKARRKAKIDAEAPISPEEISKPMAEILDSKKESKAEPKEGSEVELKEVPEEEPKEEAAPEPPKKKRGRPKKEKAEVPELFTRSPELTDIANEKFVVEEEAPEMMKKLAGKTFAEIYQTNFGLLTTIAKVSFKYEGKVPYEMIEYARTIIEAEKENNE